MLIKSSPFFDVLLSGPFKKEKTINLDFSKADVYPALSLVMHGEGDITEKNVEQMIKTTDFLGFRSVVKVCEEFLIQSLDCENGVEFYRFGSDYSFVNLKCAALNCIRENFNSLAQGADPYILEVPEQYLSKILAQDGLKCKEEDVWKFILNWSIITI